MKTFRMLTAALVLSVAAGLVLPTTPAAAQGKKTSRKAGDRGRIDWRKGVVYATGYGAIDKKIDDDAVGYLNARRAALADARRNLLATVESVRVDSQTLVRDFRTVSDVIREQISGVVKNSDVFAEHKTNIGNGTIVEVTVSMPLYGEDSLSSIVLPEEFARNAEAAPEEPNDSAPEPVRPAIPPKIELPRSLPNNGPLPEPNDNAPITSLIVDVRGTGVERSMSPKIRRPDGTEVWGTVKVSVDYVLDHGIVVYANSLSEARRDGRAGSNPLVVRAAGRAGNRYLTDAVVSSDDAGRILEANSKNGFLDKFRVIFIVDPGK